MTPRDRIFCGAILAVTLALLGGGSAAAAIERPNALDRRIDALRADTLMSKPAALLVDPDRQAAAQRRTHWTTFGWVTIELFEAAALLYLWSSGGAAATRDWLRRHLRSEWSVRFLFGATLALIARLAALLPSFYLYRVERVLQLSTELTATWGLFWLFHTLLAMVVAGLIAAVVLGLAARTHQWYAYTIVAVLAVSVGWSYASPYIQAPLRGVHPLGGVAHGRLDSMLRRAGLSGVALLESGDDSPLGRAVVLGARANRRIVLTHSLVAGDTEPEVEYRVAYELARIVHGDLLSIALIEGGIIIVFAAIAIVIADRVPFRRDDDPLSRLAIVGALFALVYLAAVPVRNAGLRSYDFDADRYAVALTGNPSAAVRALVRESDQRMEEVCPESAASLFLYSTAGLGARIAAINHVPDRCSY